MPTVPAVSVVIPTLRRPELLLRALRSVFAQTIAALEVIVVVDGPDDETVAALRGVSDPRLRWIVNPRSLTAAGARNVGAANARADWLAFLDDDDEWLPAKLEKQLALAQDLAATRGGAAVLVTCLSRIVTPTGTFVRPEVVYDNAQTIDDYLFDRQATFGGASFIQTSSYLVPRTLYQQSPFQSGPHDDWDFLIRLTKQQGARIETVPEVLVTLYFEEPRPSLSKGGTWAASLAWLDSVRTLFTPRAYSGFCLGVVGTRAAKEGAYAAFLPLIARAFANGSPRAVQVATYLAFWMVPEQTRRRLRALRQRRTLRGAQPAV